MTMRTREKSCKELGFRPCGSDLLVPRPFYQRGGRLKIEIASPGSLDTLYFKDDNVDIFVTVGSVEKKNTLKTKFGILEERIFYFRGSSFGRSIKRVTNGRGVDVVNSLASDLLREICKTLARFGRFFEIGNANFTKNTRLGMPPFENSVSFASVDLTKLAQYKPRLMRRLLDNVYLLMSKGTVLPTLPLSTYHISELETTLPTLQTGKAMGKIVFVPHQDDHVQVRSRP
ncbi:hypothetical protein AARAC_000530 [Aspergillus arachidicola]|uniref:Enoyl reductase (ER) domain-containing protein n=1 Tax=Aspergillus arachidicola TaxID=656916 RepID=A0A2G7G7T2_9EURO|nr:hypothetical protein AARAC_000530 [Aspergillus arachidicola]